MLNLSAELSYARSSDIAKGGAVSRQSVRNHLLSVNISEKEPREEQKSVSELHIFADEDHVHMQKKNKEKDKKNKMVLLVVVSEGLGKGSGGRNQLVNPMSIVDENLSGKVIWSSVEGYISRAYDVSHIDKIYLHCDGGKWIKTGLENFANVYHVMDEYHINKELKKITSKYPHHHIREVVMNGIIENDKNEIERYLINISDDDKAIRKFIAYLFNNWESIRNRKVIDIPGSCTEGQVSHVLSKRLSRNPMGWSERGLGQMWKLRALYCNGGKITPEDVKLQEPKETYKDYADRYIDEYMNEISSRTDSFFDGFVMDVSSGTQTWIRNCGRLN